MKKLDVLGIALKECSVKEALKLTEQYLNGGGLNTVVYVSARQLVAAAGDRKQKEYLEAMDLTVYADQDILKVLNEAGRNEVRETEQREFLREFLKRIAKKGCRVYLLAASPEELDILRSGLENRQGSLIIAGQSTVPEMLDTERGEALVNEINSVAPQIILSGLPFPLQNAFICENKMIMNASIFLGLPEYGLSGGRPRGFMKFTKYLYKTILKRKLLKYNHEEKTE